MANAQLSHDGEPGVIAGSTSLGMKTMALYTGVVSAGSVTVPVRVVIPPSRQLTGPAGQTYPPTPQAKSSPPPLPKPSYPPTEASLVTRWIGSAGPPPCVVNETGRVSQ